jgi:hypothetical protein
MPLYGIALLESACARFRARPAPQASSPITLAGWPCWRPATAKNSTAREAGPPTQPADSISSGWAASNPTPLAAWPQGAGSAHPLHHTNPLWVVGKPSRCMPIIWYIDSVVCGHMCTQAFLLAPLGGLTAANAWWAARCKAIDYWVAGAARLLLPQSAAWNRAPRFSPSPPSPPPPLLSRPLIVSLVAHLTASVRVPPSP